MPITVDTCCGFVTDMKSAVTMIILFAIVTNPIVSWILVRHTYAIRASCLINLDDSQPDVLGLSLTNFLSFGFGGAAGNGPSCLQPKQEETTTEAAGEARVRRQDEEPAPEDSSKEESDSVKAAKYFGWCLLIADIVFLIASLYFFAMVFRGSDRTAAGVFIWAAGIAVFMGFIYGIMYVHICITVGHAFPLFEFVFTIFDLLLWIYFIIIVISYRTTDAS